MEIATAYQRARFGQGSGDIYLDEVDCTGSETSLLLCPSDPIGKHNCRHNEDAGVACTGVILKYIAFLPIYAWSKISPTSFHYFLFIQSLQTACMVTCDWLEVAPTLKEELRFASTKFGALCVMITGTALKQWWSALSLGFHLRVSTYVIYQSRPAVLRNTVVHFKCM